MQIEQLLEVDLRLATRGGHIHPGVVSTVQWGPEGRGCAQPRVGGRTTPLPWPDVHGGAGAVLGEGAVSSLGAFEEPPSKRGAAPRRAAQRARTCSCLPRARTRFHWRRPGRGGGQSFGKKAAQLAAMTPLTPPSHFQEVQREEPGGGCKQSQGLGRAAEHCQGPALGMTPESGCRGRKSESEPRAG